jgi:hypothetical protein
MCSINCVMRVRNCLFFYIECYNCLNKGGAQKIVNATREVGFITLSGVINPRRRLGLTGLPREL